MELKDIKSLVRDIPDFPHAGILFKDITPVLQHPQALAACTDHILEGIAADDVDLVAGIESRGFILGPGLATRLQAGFVPIRKKGKLPAKTLSASYELEYGIDTIEMHADAVRPGQRVLLHDDLLATGGTAEAACNLIRQAGGEVLRTSFLIELGFLQGRARLGAYDVHALLTY